MSRATKLFAVAGVLLMLGSLAGPAVAQDDTNETALHVSIDQDADGNVTILVTEDDAPVEGATVVVDAEVNETEDETSDDGDDSDSNESGSDDLEDGGEEEPADEVDSDETVSDDGVSDEETEEEDETEGEGEESDDASTDDSGTDSTDSTDEIAYLDVNEEPVATEHQTDENGTVELPAPAETIDATVSVEHGDADAEATATLTGADELDVADAFGQAVSAYVHMLKGGDATTAIGPQVAEFVLENNPGNAPDHAGPPAWVTGDEREPPGQDDEREPGPPAHANGSGPSDDGDGGEDEEELEDDADDDSDDEDEDGDG